MEDYNKTVDPSTPIDEETLLREAQERLLRKRAELGTKTRPKSICTSELGYRVNEVKHVKEVSEANEESPSGDFSPSVVSKTKIQNTKDKKPTAVLPIASDEPGLSAWGDDTEAERLFRAGRYAEIAGGEFRQLAWGVSAGKSWQEDGVSETWEFCRYLLAHPEFRKLRGAALSRKLRRLTDLDEELLDMIL